MDPQATFELFLKHAKAGNGGEAYGSMCDYSTWVGRGGFMATYLGRKVVKLQLENVYLDDGNIIPTGYLLAVGSRNEGW